MILTWEHEDQDGEHLKIAREAINAHMGRNQVEEALLASYRLRVRLPEGADTRRQAVDAFIDALEQDPITKRWINGVLNRRGIRAGTVAGLRCGLVTGAGLSTLISFLIGGPLVGLYCLIWAVPVGLLVGLVIGSALGLVYGALRDGLRRRVPGSAVGLVAALLTGGLGGMPLVMSAGMASSTTGMATAAETLAGVAYIVAVTLVGVRLQVLYDRAMDHFLTVETLV